MGGDDIRQNIDDELRAYLRCVDEYQTSTAEIAAACKSGIFDIAQARKAMAGKGIGVSQIHYPARMRARATVGVVRGEEGTFQLKRRERDESPKDEDGEEDPGADRDPIKWFGLLVPVHLKNSQATFTKCLESVVCAAKASVEMQEHYKRYQELLKQTP